MSVTQYDRLHRVSLSFNIKAIFVKLPRYLAWLPVQIRNMVFQSANIHTVTKKKKNLSLAVSFTRQRTGRDMIVLLSVSACIFKNSLNRPTNQTSLYIIAGILQALIFESQKRFISLVSFLPTTFKDTRSYSDSKNNVWPSTMANKFKMHSY